MSSSFRPPKLQHLPTPWGWVAFRTWGHGRNRIFFYHGFPGTGAQAALAEPLLDRFQLSLCAFDRPGYGESTHHSRFELKDSAELVRALAKELGWDRFHHLAVSGGTPYALAASTLPGSLSLTTISAVGPLDHAPLRQTFRPLTRAAIHAAPWIPEGVYRRLLPVWLRQLRRATEPFGSVVPSRHPSPAEALLVRELLLDTIEESLRQGPRGMLADLRRFVRPWNVDWHALPARTTFWHGFEDQSLGVEHSKELARRVPSASLRLCSGHDHFSLAILALEEILRETLRMPRSAAVSSPGMIRTPRRADHLSIQTQPG